MIAKIGENIVISDLRVFDISDSKSSFYVHNSYRKNIGKIISFINIQQILMMKTFRVLEKIYVCILLP